MSNFVFLSDFRLWLSAILCGLTSSVVPSLISYACVRRLPIKFLTFFSIILGERVYLLKAGTLYALILMRPSCLVQLTLFIFAVYLSNIACACDALP